MDALGAAITMKNFVNMSGKEAYVVYDPEQLMPEVSRAIDLVNETEEGFAHIIKLETAFDMKTENSLLIMVDHSKTTQTLSLDFYKSFSKLVVIDHHRRDDDFPEHALLSYIESSASSASELAVELLQFHEYNSKMTVTDASIALAGIELDTKHFTKATTSRTFEVAAYLRSQGADNNLIKGILATKFEKYKKINEIILNSEYVAPGVVVALGKPDQKYDNVATAKAVQTLCLIWQMFKRHSRLQITKMVIFLSRRVHSKIITSKRLWKPWEGADTLMPLPHKFTNEISMKSNMISSH